MGRILLMLVNSYMKIALTATQYNRHGGEARYSVELAENLYKKGHEVHVYTSKVSTKSEGITFHHLPNIPPEYPRVLSYIPYFIQNCLNFRSHDFDIVHTAGNESLYQDIITTHSIHAAGMEYKKKYSSTGVGVLDKVLLTVENHIYTKQLFKKAICASESTKAELQHFYKIPDELIEVIPYGVNPDEFYPYENKNKDSDKITLMIVATEFLRKGVPELIHATNILAEKHDIRLMVVGSPSVEGNGRGKDYYDSLANKNIIFTGKVDNLNDYYNMTDIFVFPTKYEAFGLPLLEAMSCGLPVITTNIGAGNLITNYKDGIWFDDPTSVDDIVNKIEMVIQDEQLRKRLSREARKTAMKYTWERMANEIVRVYEHEI